jgi:hypothetical protein
MWITIIWTEMRVPREELWIYEYLIVNEDFEDAWLSYFQFCCDIARVSALLSLHSRYYGIVIGWHPCCTCTAAIYMCHGYYKSYLTETVLHSSELSV